MLEQIVRLTVHFTPHEGKAEACKVIAEAMTESTKAEPGTLGYEWFVSADGQKFRLVETYIDAGAVEKHFEGAAVRYWVPKLVEVCSVEGFEVYGDPGPIVTAKAAGLGAVFFGYWLGINR